MNVAAELAVIRPDLDLGSALAHVRAIYETVPPFFGVHLLPDQRYVASQQAGPETVAPYDYALGAMRVLIPPAAGMRPRRTRR